MNDNFNDQKEKLVSLSHEINLLRQQVNYLLRNEKALGLLDLDVLMNRTHTIYDMLCAINLGENADDEDMDFDAEAFTNMIGAMMTEENPDEAKNEEIIEDQKKEESEEEIPQPEPEEVIPTEPEPVWEPEPETVPEQKPEPEPVFEPEPVSEPESVTEQPVSKPAGDEFGFFFRFEDVPSEEKKPEEQPEEPAVEAQPAEPVYVDDKLVHFVKEIPEDQIPDRDIVGADELVRDNPYEMPKMEEPDFELTTHETLGEKMIQNDHSLAAKLQQNPIPDLKSVIGINDKFLFVNELFGGSMEKYNKSIENLNDLKTLNGAMIYLNELKIELQWNSSNEAYNKLTELVRRKFE